MKAFVLLWSSARLQQEGDLLRVARRLAGRLISFEAAEGDVLIVGGAGGDASTSGALHVYRLAGYLKHDPDPKGSPAYTVPIREMVPPDPGHLSRVVAPIVERASASEPIPVKSGAAWEEIYGLLPAEEDAGPSAQHHDATMPDALSKLQEQLRKRHVWRDAGTRAWVWDTRELSFRTAADFAASLEWETLEEALVSRLSTDGDTFAKLEQFLYKYGTSQASKVPPAMFERICKTLVQGMGFEVEQTQQTHDGGVDLYAYDTSPFRLRRVYVFSCKRERSVGVAAIRELDSVVGHNDAVRGILLTTGGCTREAKDWARNKPIDIIEGGTLRDLFREYSVATEFV